jgi:hypothetical protein
MSAIGCTLRYNAEMKLAGGCLIVLAVLTTLMILEELALAAHRNPVGFSEYLRTFFGYWWP